jgi:parvulin-like peptidyl-prolyl isomerase
MKPTMCRFALPLFLLLVLSPLYFMRGQDSDGHVVARAGSVFVSEQEFQERFELTPGLYRHRKPQLEQEKLKILYSMVAEKLLAQEARERGLDTAAYFRDALADLVKLFARDELYRREVRLKVTVTPAEISRGIRQARQQLLIDFLFFSEEATARFVRSQLHDGKAFDRQALDPSLHAVRDTATVIWGDADTTIEAAAYRLGANELSPVIRAGEGWYILRLRRAERNALYADMPPLTLRERVLSRIRMRKEAVREQEYVNEALRNQPSSSPPGTFRAVADAVTRVMQRHYAKPSTALTSALADEVLALLTGREQDTLITAGTRVWSVDEAVRRLASRGFSIGGDSVRGVASRLYGVFREWVEQELLSQEALRQGLDRTPEVERQVAPWGDHYLAGMTERRIHDQVHVTDTEVYAYMHTADTSQPLPQVQLRVLHTAEVKAMQDAFQFIEQGGTLEDAVHRFSIDANAAQGGITPFFPVTERAPLGMIASRLEPGQFYGPIRDSSGCYYIQLLQKRGTAAPSDTSFAGRYARAAQDLLQMKQRRAVTLFTAQSAEARGFEIYSDRLKALKVTPLPMLAYRLLGFGGRMFAAPFVSPRLEWLDVETPKGKILP